MISKHKNKNINSFLKQNKITKKVNEDFEIDPIAIPHVSIYNYKVLISTEEEAIVPVYITDYYQQEYAYKNESLRFTLRVQVDDNVRYIENLKAGDHNINLGRLSKGDHHFNFEVTDEQNRKSMRIFNELRVKNPDEFIITPAQTYTITDQDLTRHNIKKNNSQVLEDMINCRVGLTALFKEIKDRGYKKCILPNGIYRVNKSDRNGTGTETPIVLPSHLTIDMNGSTWKLHPYDDREYGGVGQVGNLLVKFDNCEEVSLTNGTLEGDYFERLEMIWEDGTNAIQGLNGEGNNTVIFYGGKYNTLENMTIKQTTGYVHGTWYGKEQILVHPQRFTDNIAINSNGEQYADESQEISTCDYTDITKLLSNGYIATNIWLGYGGIRGRHWDYDINFYDENRSFIEGFKAQQHRRVKIPRGSKFVRVTLKTRATDAQNVVFHNQPSPRYCALKNIEAIDNRTCFAPAQFQHLLYENVNFTRSGQSITPCAIDFEDGWEQMQDFFMKNCNVIERSGTTSFIANSGINYVLEDCDNFCLTWRGGVHGITVRNTSNCTIQYGFADKIKNTFRAYNNTRLQTSWLEGNIEKKEPVIFKNNEIIDTALGSNQKTGMSYHYIECDMLNCNFTDYCVVKNCNFTRNDNNTKGLYIPDMRVYDSNFYTHDKDVYYKFSFNKENAERSFNRCKFYCKTELADHNCFNSGTWNECNFYNKVKLWCNKDVEMGNIQFNKCVFEQEVEIDLRNNAKVQFNNCTFKGGIRYHYNGEANTELNNCVIS